MSNISKSDYTVYAIINRQTGKVYIGCTNDLKRRKREHLTMLKKGFHFNTDLQEDFDIFGVDNFEISPLETNIVLENAYKREKFNFHRFSKGFGVYNKIPPCNDINLRLYLSSEEHKAKLRELADKREIAVVEKETGDFIGLFPSITEAANYTKDSRERICQICDQNSEREAGKNYRGTQRYIYFYSEYYIPTEDIVISDAMLNCTDGSSRPVQAIEQKTGEILEFPSIRNASKQLGIDRASISTAIKTKKPTRGYYWRPASDEPERQKRQDEPKNSDAPETH